MYYLVYHSADLDGHCCGAIARRFFESKGMPFTLVPMDHGGELTIEPVQGDIVYFMDFAPVAMVESLMYLGCRLLVLDHHETAKPLLDKVSRSSVIRMDLAACEIVWQYFHPYSETPSVVKLAGRYDTFRQTEGDWKGETLPFHYGMEGCLTDPIDDKAMRNWARLLENDGLCDTVIAAGRVIENYVTLQNREAMKNAFLINLCGYKFVGCFGVQGSLAFKDIYDPDKHDGMMAIEHGGNCWHFRLYTDKPETVDILWIAKSFGGGGHKQACGFETSYLSYHHIGLRTQQTYLSTDFFTAEIFPSQK